MAQWRNGLQALVLSKYQENDCRVLNFLRGKCNKKIKKNANKHNRIAEKYIFAPL